MKKIILLLVLCFGFYRPLLADTLTVYSTPGDGWIIHSGSVWSTVRSASTGTTAYSSLSHPDEVTAYWSIGAWKISTTYHVRRAFFTFDTSSLPEGATITDVKFYLYGGGALSYAITVDALQASHDGTLSIDDFDAFSGSSFGSMTLPANGSQYISFNSTGLSAIVDDGNTEICVMEHDHDYSNVTGEVATDYAGNYFSAYTGTDRDPRLVITYTAPVTYVISGTLREKESDASGFAANYIIYPRADFDASTDFFFGTAASDGTYSEAVTDGATEYNIIAIHPTGTYAPVVLGEQVLGVE